MGLGDMPCPRSFKAGATPTVACPRRPSLSHASRQNRHLGLPRRPSVCPRARADGSGCGTNRFRRNHGRLNGHRRHKCIAACKTANVDYLSFDSVTEAPFTRIAKKSSSALVFRGGDAFPNRPSSPSMTRTRPGETMRTGRAVQRRPLSRISPEWIAAPDQRCTGEYGHGPGAGYQTE